jgi:3-dehydroquinate synthase
VSPSDAVLRPDPIDTCLEVSHPVVIQQDLRLLFTRDVFAPPNPTLTRVLTPRDEGSLPRVLVFWDEGLAQAWPDMDARIRAWFDAWPQAARLVGDPLPVAGGERVKNDRTQLERVWAAIDAAHLCRHSYVLVAGGGAVLDMVGFGAATAHRGIPLVRLPTTSLSQADGGIGVKNGVNWFGKKNWLGSFAIPHAVVNDAEFLHRLPMRDRRAGLVEAVKVSLIRDAAFFDYIEAHASALAACVPGPFEAVVRTSARHHLEHIATAGDPFEKGSARPLDFGHWAAHKLEQMTGFALSHGDAVAIGLALDILYAERTGLLPPAVAARILAVLTGIGFVLYHPALAERDAAGRRVVLKGLEEFREHLGGRLTIPMIRAVGDKLDVHSMDAVHVDGAIATLEARYCHG